MGVIFRGSTDSRSFGEFTVNVPDPSTDIRNQGLQILQAWQKKSQYDQTKAREVLDALKTKAQIEADYRQKAFDTNNADNKRIATIIHNNAKVDIQNARQSAENIGRKYKAIAELIPATFNAAVGVDAALEKIAEKKVKEEAAAGVSGVAYIPGSIQEQPTAEETKGINDQALATEKEKLGAIVKLSTGQYLVDPSMIESYSRAGLYRKRALLKYWASEEAEIVTGRLTHGLFTKNFITRNGLTMPIGEAYKGINPSAYSPQEARIETARVAGIIQDAVRQQYKGTIFEKDYNKTIAPKVKAFTDEKALSVFKEYDKGAESRMNGELQNAYIVGAWRTNRAKYENDPFGDQKAASDTLDAWNLMRPEGVTQKQWIDNFFTQVRSAMDVDKLDAKIGLSFLEGKFLPSDWPKAKSKTTYAAHFPKIKNLIVNSAEAQIVRKTEALTKSQEQLKILEEATFEEWRQKINQFPTLEAARASIINLPESQRKKALGYLKEPVHFTQINAIVLAEKFERQKKDDLMSEREWHIWIDNQPITQQQKEAWKKNIKEWGGGINKKDRDQVLKSIEETVINSVGGGKFFGMGGKPVHQSYKDEIELVQQEVVARARQLMDPKNPNQLNYNEALKQAFEEIFTDGWSKRKTEGNRWYRNPADQSGIATLSSWTTENSNELPYETFVNSWQGSGGYGAWMNDGTLINFEKMKPEMRNFKVAIESNQPYNPGPYVTAVCNHTGMTPTEFLESYIAKYNSIGIEKGWPALDVDGKSSEQLQAEEALVQGPSYMRRVAPVENPSPEATEISYHQLTNQDPWSVNPGNMAYINPLLFDYLNEQDKEVV